VSQPNACSWRSNTLYEYNFLKKTTLRRRLNKNGSQAVHSWWAQAHLFPLCRIIQTRRLASISLKEKSWKYCETCSWSWYWSLRRVSKKNKVKRLLEAHTWTKKLALESEPKVLRKTEWINHVGLGENVELAKMIEVVYQLMCSLDYIVNGLNLLVHLFTIQNVLHTALFLCVGTFFIMYYEIAIPIAMIFSALQML